MKNQFKKKSLATAVILATASSAPVSAQVLEEIVVTATKRQESIQDVAVSVSAMTGEQLSALGLSDMADITQQFPGFQVNSWSPQLTIFNLRGISQNNFVDNLEAPIAVYQDEAYVASMNAISGKLFDVERVEVLRGPQGTLFGRNATGGLIHYISRGADDEELNGYAEVKAGSFSRRSFEGAVGGSLSDNVRGRVSMRYEEADGYIKADTSIPPVDPRAIGGADGYALRATLQVDFSDTLQGNFIAKYNKDDDVPTGGYVFENCEDTSSCPTDVHGRAIVQPGVVSGDVHLHQNDTKGFLNRDTLNVTAKFTKDLSNGNEFVSITNYMDLDKQYLEDGDAFPAPIVVFAQDAEITQFTQEFRLSGDTDKLKWQVGAYYMDYQFDGDAYTIGAPNIGLSFQLAGAGIIANPVAGPNDPDGFPFDGRSDRVIDLDVENMSLFGQVDYSLTDATTLTAGLRWSDDTKDLNWLALFSSNQQTTPIPYAATQSNAAFNGTTILNQFTDDQINYDDIAARLSLQHQFSEDTLGFISWNRGIKGGNWTISTSVTPDRFTHKEEVLNAYEIGVKSDVSDTMRVNATAYYYDYDDYQNFVASTGAGPAPQVGNSDATAYGAELELFWVPTDNLDVLIGAALSQSEVDRIVTGGLPVLDAEFPNAPSTSANYLIRYHAPVSEGEVAVQFDGAWYGDQFLEVTNGPGTVQEAYNVSNLSLGYTTDSYSVTLWSKNVFDETYKAYSLDLGFLGATTYYAPPRTSGVTLKYEF